MIQKWGGLAVKSPLFKDFCQLIIDLNGFTESLK